MNPGASEAKSPPSLAPALLRSRTWKRFLRGPDAALLEELYVPALANAVRYDRCCAYFSSSVLAAAARGFAQLIMRLTEMGEQAPKPAVRLIVNEELSAEDVRALTETGDTKGLEAVLQKRLRKPEDALARHRLEMLAWLVKQGWLEVRVGVMRQGEGIVHAKYGLMIDEVRDAVVFNGSGNESAQGLRGNYERLEISTSWGDPERYTEYAEEFESLWADTHPTVHTLTLPEALRLRLIRLSPKKPPVLEPSASLERQKSAMRWRFVIEAPYLPTGAGACDSTAMVDLWPHQRRVVEETAGAWPEGRLLCDEVGMGKTIEAILILRRLLAGRGVRRALLLVPAGLLRQWQAELREKGGLLVPQFEGAKLVWPDEREQAIEGVGEALKQDLLLMSRETARTERNLSSLMEAQPWDLVVLDESHAARRRRLEEGEFNQGTLLLNLLRALQLKRQTRGFLLLSATPMQTHPVEPWDLVGVLGEGDAWLAEFDAVRDYYAAIAASKAGTCTRELALRASRPALADPRFPAPPGKQTRLTDAEAMVREMVFAPPSRRPAITDWLRRGSPLVRRMHRNTRGTLKRYFEQGLLTDRPASREVTDERFDFIEAAERQVYNSVGQYIDRRFRELEDEKPGKGFVMTVYRRRASSSPFALERSLERRREGLKRVIQQRAYEVDLGRADIPDSLDSDDLPDQDAPLKVSGAFPESPQVAERELKELDPLLQDLRSLRGRDTKRDRFFEVLRRVRDDGRAVLVFTEYVDTMVYLREQLQDHYRQGLGCYSGEGGCVWSGESWDSVTKDTITAALRAGRIQVLICTDAASEGLNLQAAGAVINYDLPWNPSRVEQRIGRVDRIGQKLSEVKVVNLFLKDSVDDQVYRALRYRCGLFEHFVGAMQPVLALARRMLEGASPVDVAGLENQAAQVDHDPLMAETYQESGAEVTDSREAPIRRSDLARLLEAHADDSSLRITKKKGTHCFAIAGSGLPRVTVSAELTDLEHDRGVLPLNPELPHLAKFAAPSGERLPLVVASRQSGGFRSSVAFWVQKGELVKIESIAQLEERLDQWSGELPDPREWLEAERSAGKAAEQLIKDLDRRACQREAEGLARQVCAAKLRLQRELGRYLACLDEGVDDLPGLLHRQLARDIASAARLREAVSRLGSFPEWTPEECRELGRHAAEHTENQRKAHLMGKGIDAALEDPRWLAAQTTG